MSATLSTLRERILNQIQAASGLTEPLAVTASSEDLSGLTTRLEAILQDSGNTRWSDADLTEAIRRAVEQYSRYSPSTAITTLTLSAAGREVDISSISDLVRVEKVWWPYDSTDPDYPPNWRQFEVWPGDILFIDDESKPAQNDKVRLWYTTPHTLDGLDGESSTTIPTEDISFVLSGAAHFAAWTRAIELSEQMTIDRDTVKELERFADEMGKNFRYGAKLDLRAWTRRARAYPQEDLDEGIRWALHRYSEVSPARSISSISLSSSGREIDVSALSGLLNVERVWWDYDSSDPEYPPNWRNFELWPGDLLYIKDSDEPSSGDTVRVWYTTMHTLNGLDSETTTTFPDSDETLIVTGAVGYITQERIQEEITPWGSRKLRDWAEQRLKEFERGLQALARRQAARHSGVAPSSDLDRWDDTTGGWA